MSDPQQHAGVRRIADGTRPCQVRLSVLQDFALELSGLHEIHCKDMQ